MRKYSSLALLVSLLAVGVFGYTMAGRRVLADTSSPPASMSTLDAARLHAAIAELNSANQKIDAIKASVAPLEKQATAILSAYRISAADLGKSVSVDFDTGAITRAPTVAQAQPPKAAQK